MMTELMTQNDERERSPEVRGRRFGRGWMLAAWVAFGLAAVLVVSVWSIRGLGGLPDVGDPFDVAAARRPVAIADEDNAFVAYAAADPGGFRFPAALAKVDLKALTWSKAGTGVREFLEQKRSAMEIWRQGSERPDALYNQPGASAVDTLLPLSQDMRFVAHLAGLEGSRLEEGGAMGQAWDWYRAMLRFSRHVGRHACLIERHIGAAVHEDATRRILRWAADPRVDGKQLRRALDDTIAADALTAPLSDALKFEYLIYLREAEELRAMVTDIPLPGGKGGMLEGLTSQMGNKAPVQRFWLRASNDVERSRRAMRLLFANLLAQVDRPAAQRAPVAVREPVLIYAPDPTAPASARAVTPEFLAKSLDHNAFSRTIFHYDEPGYRPYQAEVWEGKGPLARERRRRSVLIVRLAAELFRREHDAAPATAGALLGPYLKELPEGIAPGDPIPDVIE
jgi:hypothetical protein